MKSPNNAFERSIIPSGHARVRRGGRPLDASVWGPNKSEMLRLRLTITLLLASFVTACSVGQDTKSAKAVVSHCREQMARSALGEIYDGAADDWKTADSRDDSTALVGAVNRKLGAVKTSTQTDRHDNVSTTTGHKVTLVYHTKFELGDGDETFVVRLVGGHGPLAGYLINSMAMIIK
jgi:hypothetical protein